jgi:hypothetical protein
VSVSCALVVREEIKTVKKRILFILKEFLKKMKGKAVRKVYRYCLLFTVAPGMYRILNGKL